MIVYFVMTSGEDTDTEDTPAPEETTSMWQGEPGGHVFVIAGTPVRELTAPALSRSA